MVEPCFLSWWKAEIAQATVTAPVSADTQQETLLKLIMQGIRSPRIGISLIKAAFDVLRLEGFSGLVRRIRGI